LAEASDRSLVVDPATIPVPALAARVCQAFGLDPLAAIASGGLLLTVPAKDAASIRRALEAEGIACAEIGAVEAGPIKVWCKMGTGFEVLPRPDRDEIARVFANSNRI
jgi:hydrogenase maturation factor